MVSMAPKPSIRISKVHYLLFLEFINRFPKIKEVYNQKFRYCSNINKRNIVIRDKDIYVGKVDEVDTRR